MDKKVDNMEHLIDDQLFEEYKNYMKSMLQNFLASFMKEAAEKELDVSSFIDNFVSMHFSNGE